MNKKPVVNIGVQRFDKLRKQGSFYIDKTDFIREWWETGSEVTLITRPRRFGKTLNMSMLECFFSRKMDCHVHDVIATDGKENRHKTMADINEIALKSCSNFDVVKNASCNDHPERFYHGFVPGLMVGFRDQFEIQQTGKADSDAMISF